jgi:hypothetical protein
MTCNIGKGDRLFRIIGGLIVLLAGILAGSWWALIGVLLILTGIIRYCPLYVPLKISTEKKPPDKPV